MFNSGAASPKLPQDGSAAPEGRPGGGSRTYTLNPLTLVVKSITEITFDGPGLSHAGRRSGGATDFPKNKNKKK